MFATKDAGNTGTFLVGGSLWGGKMTTGNQLVSDCIWVICPSGSTSLRQYLLYPHRLRTNSRLVSFFFLLPFLSCFLMAYLRWINSEFRKLFICGRRDAWGVAV